MLEGASPVPASGNGKWLLVATNENWKKCLESKSWGVKDRYKLTIQRMKLGDEFLVHLTDNKTAGICKVTREYYYDTRPTWGSDDDLYPHRIGFEPIKIPTAPIDAKDSYDRHLRKNHGTAGGYFGNPIRKISDAEFAIFESDINKNLGTGKTDNQSSSNVLESGQKIGIDSSNEGRILLEQAINKAKEQYQSDPRHRAIEKEVIMKYGSIFNPQNLDNLTAADFKSFLLYDNNKHWKNIQRWGTRIVTDMDRLKSVLRNLLDESKPIRERLDAILPNGNPSVKGLGKAILTPILLVVYPEQYSVFNEITQQALEYVRIYPDFAPQQTLGEQYQKVNEIIKDIAFKNALSLWQMDSVWWDIVEKIKQTNKNTELDTRKPAQLKEKYSVFLTGYDHTNLEISERNSLLGWRDKSGTLSEGDIVYVFDTTNHKIKSCFRILSLSNNKNPIWHEETSPSSTSKIIYPYRWEVDIIADDLDITTDKIFEFEPFRNDKKIFSLLIRNRHPRSLESTQYDEFRNFLLDKINLEYQNQNYLLLMRKPDSPWEDIEGKQHHYGDNVPNHSKITPNSNVIFFRLEDSMTFLGYSGIDSITDEKRGRYTPAGNPITEKIAKLKEYHEFVPPRQATSEVEHEIKSLPGYNNQFAILPITKEIFEMILSEPESYSIEKLYENTMIGADKIEEWEDLLKEKKQVIFYGPPGTGKTFVAIEFSKYLVSKYGGEYEIVQFHPSYGYEEFIEGIRPKLINGQLDYQPVDGIFKTLAKSATRNPRKKFILIIDEINRGNLSKILGELIFSLEYRSYSSKVILPYTNESFTVPDNLWIIGTMNSADRSIALVDYALRRRFFSIEFMPDSKILYKCLLKERYQPSAINVDKIKLFFENLNKTIADDEKLGRHYQLGHSYLIKEGLDKTKIRRIWKYALVPLLEEYYFEEPEQIAKFEEDAKEILGFKLTTDREEEQNTP